MCVDTINLPFIIKQPVLALGAQLKNTLCFAWKSKAYISRIHQDLSIRQDWESFEKDARYFIKKSPRVIVYDPHPEYSSLPFIRKLFSTGAIFCPVYHHHAHIGSCMVENGLKGQQVIGIACDGTGAGPKNQLWGAEFLICNYSGFRRLAHLKEIPLPGGERAIFEPWRTTALWLERAFKGNLPDLKIGWTKKLDKKKWHVIRDMAEKKINSPVASSMGRLFDAAASLILSRYSAAYEAQLPIELEAQAACSRNRKNSGEYTFSIGNQNKEYVLDPGLIFQGIVKDLKAKLPKETVAYKFHLTIAKMIEKMCTILRKDTGINQVVLSGGVFQNKLLLGLSSDLLYRQGFKVFVHKKLPSNDASVSLGQAAIAGFGRRPVAGLV